MCRDVILIVDDHALFRSGIASMVSMALSQVSVRDSASLEEALSDPALLPTIVLLDIQLRGANGLDGIALLHRRWPSARIVVVSADDQPGTVQEALSRGAVAFLSKADRPDHMIAVLGRLLKPARDPSVPGDTSRALLTPRQMEVLDLVGRGLSNKMIGRRLGLSEHTVRGHVQALLTALSVARRAEAVFEARQRGLIP